VRPAWLGLFTLVLLASGCGEHKSVLDEGVCRAHLGCDPPHRVSEHEALSSGARSLAMWKRELRRGVTERPDLRFDNLTPAELTRRLEKAADEHGFEVVSVKLHRPRQLAPEVVVRTTHYVDVARSARDWIDRVDPKVRNEDDRTGWRFEGFYLRAEDEHGVPFFILFNYWRERESGGGQWARSERLFPFDHG
jgi:hypothetical protein